MTRAWAYATLCMLAELGVVIALYQYARPS